MALEFICSAVIEDKKKIVLPRCSNLYKIDFSNKKICFYYDNPRINEVKLNTWEVPANAREMDFEFRSDGKGDYVIISRFYDSDGKLLKIGNR